MKKLLLGLSIAALAFTSIQDSYAGIFSKKSPEQKAQEKVQEADVKAMKTCAADLTQQTFKSLKSFITCLDKLKDAAVMKDASPNTSESVNKLLLLRDAANDFLRLLLYCYAGCVNIENALKAKSGSEAQKSYFQQAIDAREIISNIRVNLGIDMVSLVELMRKNSLGIFNAEKVKEIANKLDGDMRGIGKKNTVGLSVSWKSALEKFEDQAIKYYKLEKDNVLSMTDEEIQSYPLLAFTMGGKHIEYIRKILSGIFPAFIAFANDICEGKPNDGSSYIATVRQELQINGLQISGELEYDENEEKIKKSRRQGVNKKKKIAVIEEGSSETGSMEYEDNENYKLSEEDEEFFENERQKSAEKRGSESTKSSNKTKLKRRKNDEMFDEEIKASSKRKYREAEDIYEDEDDELSEEAFDNNNSKKVSENSRKKKEADEEELPSEENTEEEEISRKKQSPKSKKELKDKYKIEEMDEKWETAKKKRAANQRRQREGKATAA